MAKKQSRKMKPYNLSILNKIDEIYTDNPEFGYRCIHRQLLEDGFNRLLPKLYLRGGFVVKFREG